MPKLILHLDLNNFYASVECKRNPSIADKPVAVSGSPELRHGVVLAKNEIAKKFGVKTGDTVLEARKKAPNIVFVPPSFSEYDRLSRQMMAICSAVTSQVEPFGSDECYLDCTASQNLFGSGEEIADLLREKIRTEMGLTASVGVSFTKIFAKLGSDMKKPDATTVITEDNYKEKIWGLPVTEMCGVGRRIGAKLYNMNICTLGDLALADDRILSHTFGKVGLDLKKMANGVETDNVREYIQERQLKSIGHSLTAIRDLTTSDDVRTLTYYLAELIATRLRQHRFRAQGVSVYIRSTELETTGKQLALSSPIGSTEELARTALKLVRELWDGRALRSMGISTYNLVANDKPEQLSFFDGERNCDRSNEKLDIAIEQIRKRFGKSSIIRGEQMNTDIYIKKDVGDFLPFKR